MKITKEHVGKRGSINWLKPGQVYKILFVGESYCVVEDDSGKEDIFGVNDWELLPAPKPEGAPAFIKRNCSPYWRVTDIVFPSEDWASEYFKSWDRVIWPALIDPKTGMYILPED